MVKVSPMIIDIKTGTLDNAKQVASPNFDERPAGMEVDLIVIHNISLPPGEFGGLWVDALLTNSLPADQHPFFEQIHQNRVSAHVLIRRNGEITQYVPFHLRAWHAGVSQYQGRDRCNDFSIGIELEGSDYVAFEPVQYEQLARLIHCLCATYPSLSTEHITGHSQIAPGRKTDPGPFFDWNKLQTLISGAEQAP